jgi:mono/diheme cytochrome c family protein
MTEHVRDPADIRKSSRRWQVAGVWVFLVLVLSFPAYRFTEGSRLSDAEVSQNAAQIAAGGELWSQNCSTCHGKMGEGITAPALNSQES